METGRGGRRPGAGRKAKRGEPTDTIVTRVKRSNRDWLMAESKQTGMGTGEVLDYAIEHFKVLGTPDAPALPDPTPWMPNSWSFYGTSLDDGVIYAADSDNVMQLITKHTGYHRADRTGFKVIYTHYPQFKVFNAFLFCHVRRSVPFSTEDTLEALIRDAHNVIASVHKQVGARIPKRPLIHFEFYRDFGKDGCYLAEDVRQSIMRHVEYVDD